VNSSAEEASYFLIFSYFFLEVVLIFLRILTSHCLFMMYSSDQEFGQTEENHADNSLVRKCFEPGNC
jgi:hypothetical protein